MEPAQTSGSGFVGRDRELANLRVALEETLSGQGRLVMLAGEPGIGKTRLAQELASLAEAQNALVLWGRCVDDRYERVAGPYRFLDYLYKVQAGPDGVHIHEDLALTEAAFQTVVNPASTGSTIVTAVADEDLRHNPHPFLSRGQRVNYWVPQALRNS